jgi:hypothetical protein
MKMNDSNTISNNNIPASSNNIVKNSQRLILSNQSRDSSNSNIGSGIRLSSNDLEASFTPNENSKDKFSPDSA